MALRESQQQNERLSITRQNPKIADAVNPSGDVSPAASLPSLVRGSSTHASPSDGPSTTIDASIWSQVGIGEDGSITYNGPTSRFHAGPLTGNGPSPLSGQALHGTSQDAGSKLAHAERLRSQYDLLDTVWAPLAKSKSMSSFGVTSEMGWQLLEMYWTWLHPLHNCIYRPGIYMHFPGVQSGNRMI